MITEEIHAAASRAAEDAYNRWHSTPNRDAYVSGFIAAAAKNAVEAVVPLIAAQALRDAAEDVRDNDDAHSHGDFCSYGPPGMCDCERGATFRWLISRAAGRCGAPDPHRGVDACLLDAGHSPAHGHRYGPLAAPSGGPYRRYPE